MLWISNNYMVMRITLKYCLISLPYVNLSNTLKEWSKGDYIAIRLSCHASKPYAVMCIQSKLHSLPPTVACWLGNPNQTDTHLQSEMICHFWKMFAQRFPEDECSYKKNKFMVKIFIMVIIHMCGPTCRYSTCMDKQYWYSSVTNFF